jgi:NAD(P)-dependent dehydrogenase (short-subunit alcohol dehydrogenase family)
MLEKKRIVVTGAAGTLGQAAATRAAAYGASVIGLDVVAGHSSDNLVQYCQVDLTNREATAACIGALGEIDALVNIAGGFAMGTAASDPDDEQWDRMFRTNVDTVRNATMAAVPSLRERERAAIVNIGALGALSGQGSMSAYCCAKSTVMKLTESLSEELKRDGINVNAVLPSIIDTPPNREAMPDADFDTWVRPEQLAEVICFLLSERASALHGVLLPVKGLV